VRIELFRCDEGRNRHRLSSEVTLIVSHTQENTSRILSIAAIARDCGFSERKLYRKIH